MISIRPTRADELDTVMPLFDQARTTMRRSGNMNQWTNGYPSRELIARDSRLGQSYVMVESGGGSVVGIFAFIHGVEPTYRRIYEGAWLDDDLPYATIHRLAGATGWHGLADACFDWCTQQAASLRVDTHRDNVIMRHVLTRRGFSYCGIIYLENGDERLAFQKLVVRHNAPPTRLLAGR